MNLNLTMGNYRKEPSNMVLNMFNNNTSYEVRSKIRKCVFITVFYQEKYLHMLEILLESLHGRMDENTDILIYTSSCFVNKIKEMYIYDCFLYSSKPNKIIFETNDGINNIYKSCKARLDFFSLKKGVTYHSILYIDTDIIIVKHISPLFELLTSDKLYAVSEGSIDDVSNFWGRSLFKEDILKYEGMPAFNTGCLLFRNCIAMFELFNAIKENIHENKSVFSTYDQPYIVYNAVKQNKYDNEALTEFVDFDHSSNPQDTTTISEVHQKTILIHFTGFPGDGFGDKLKKMQTFRQKFCSDKLEWLNDKITTIPNTISTNIQLVAVCVSYNYMDTLKFMLPTNYFHFKRIFIITQEDDIETIHFCMQFQNVTILFYDLTQKTKGIFDKYGALNMGLKYAYVQYPESWYVIIDSDILLPTNFHRILDNVSLNEETLYGCTRTDVWSTSQLLCKEKCIELRKNFKFNDLLILPNKPPSLIGCFQLFKKKCYNIKYHQDAGYGDYQFGYDNFKTFSCLKTLHIFHLGHSGRNWKGKVISFDEDITIDLEDCLFECNDLTSTNLVYNYDRTLNHKISNINV
jgi:hypothetical protein